MSIEKPDPLARTSPEKKKVDIKGESSERLLPDELKLLLQKYGTVDGSRDVAPLANNAWAMTFLPDERLGLGNATYTLIVPEGVWRREPDTTKEPIGFRKDGTPVLPVVPLRPDNFSAARNEIQVVLLNDHSPEDPKLVQAWLNQTAKEGMTLGPEFEFGIREHDVETPAGRQRAADRALTLCVEGMVEAFHDMRELADKDPAIGYRDFGATLVSLQKKAFTEADREAFIVEFTNIMAEKVPIGESPYMFFRATDFDKMPEEARGVIGYIEAAGKMYESKMLQNLAFVISEDQEVRTIVNQMAVAHGIETDDEHPERSLGELFVRKFGFNIWMTRCLHVSIGVPQYENGMIPVQAMKNAANAAIINSALFDVLNYSGNMAHGARTQLFDEDGALVDALSARAIFKNILPTSRAVGLIPSEMDFKNSKIELTLRGMANVFDRTTGVVRMTMKSGLSRVFGAMHSDVRSRDSAPLQKFLDFLEDRSNGINKPFYTGARLEGTSADVGPEMLGGNMYAVALRAVAHRSAMLASAEDMDYVQWLEKNNLLGGKTAQEIYSSSGSEAMQKERMQVVRGEIDLNRIQRLEELLNFVEKATQDESVQLPEHWQKLFADAHKGIAELKEVRSMFGAHRKLWERVYSGIREKHAKEGDVGKAGIVMYEAFCEKGGGMAAKANILTNTEIATILIDKFKVGTVRIPELDGSTKELKLDDEVMAHWLRGEENPDEEYNSARAYLTVLLYDLHAREMLKKYEEEQVV